jgi:hypothetical protein
MSAGPGEQGGDRIDPDTGEFVDDGGGGGGGGFDDDDSDTAEGAEDSFGSGGDYFDDEFDGDVGSPDPDPSPDPTPTGGDDDDDDGASGGGDTVPDIDGRKTTIRGPEAPGNQSESPQVIVDDRAGEGGQPARDPTDDAFVPDNREGLEDELGVVGEASTPRRQRIDQGVERLQADLSRRAGGAIIAGENEAVNISREDGRLRGELTEQGLDQLRGTSGQRTVAGAPVPAEPTPSGGSRADGDDFVPPTQPDPNTLDEPGSAEQAADLRADEVVAPQEAFDRAISSTDARRDPTLVRAESRARADARRDGRGEQFGDVDLSFGLGDAERDEVERALDERLPGAAPQLASVTDEDARPSSPLSEAGLVSQPTDEAFRTTNSIVAGLDDASRGVAETPGVALEAAEAGLFLNEANPAAGGSQEQFDRRLAALGEEGARRAGAAAEFAAANPVRASTAFVAGSVAEAGVVGSLSRAGSAGRLASPGSRSTVGAASQTADTFTPDLPSRRASFVEADRGQADQSLLSLSTERSVTDDLPDEIAGTDPSRRRPPDLGNERERVSPLNEDRGRADDVDDPLGSTTGSDATRRADSQLENLERMGLASDAELRGRAVDLPADDLRRLVDVERDLTASTTPARAPEVGPAVGGLLGSAQAVGGEGETLSLAASAEEEPGFAAATPRVEAGGTVVDDLVGSGAEAGVGSLGAVDEAAGALGRADTDTLAATDSALELRADVRAETRGDTRLDTDQRLDTRTDSRIDTRSDTRTDVRADSGFRFDLDQRVEPPEGARDDRDDEQGAVDPLAPFSREFRNPVTTPEEFLGDAFGGEGR